MQYECDLCGLCNTILNFCENNMDQCACQDINECTNGMAQCPNNSVCQNDVGNYTCPCASGYQGTAGFLRNGFYLVYVICKSNNYDDICIFG